MIGNGCLMTLHPANSPLLIHSGFFRGFLNPKFRSRPIAVFRLTSLQRLAPGSHGRPTIVLRPSYKRPTNVLQPPNAASYSFCTSYMMSYSAGRRAAPNRPYATTPKPS
jgi:hypothetical protein